MLVGPLGSNTIEEVSLWLISWGSSLVIIA
jgi:hypothetical protein